MGVKFFSKMGGGESPFKGVKEWVGGVKKFFGSRGGDQKKQTFPVFFKEKWTNFEFP